MFSVRNNAVKTKWKFNISQLSFLSFFADLFCLSFLLHPNRILCSLLFFTFLPSSHFFVFSLFLSIPLPLLILPLFFLPFDFAFRKERERDSRAGNRRSYANEGRSVAIQVPERVCMLASNRWTRTSVAVARVGRKRFGSHYVRRRGGGRGVRSSRVPLETGVVSDRPSRRVEPAAAFAIVRLVPDRRVRSIEEPQVQSELSSPTGSPRTSRERVLGNRRIRHSARLWDENPVVAAGTREWERGGEVTMK